MGKKSMFVRLEDEINILFREAEDGVFFFDIIIPENFNPLKNIQSVVETLLRKIRHGVYDEDAWFFALADGLFLAMQRDMVPGQVIEQFQKMQQRRDDMMRTERKKRKNQIEQELREHQRTTIMEKQKQKATDNYQKSILEKKKEADLPKTLAASSSPVLENQKVSLSMKNKLAEDIYLTNQKKEPKNNNKQNRDNSTSSGLSQGKKSESPPASKSAAALRGNGGFSAGKSDGGRSK